ncbi:MULTISPECIES: Na+/H+ antiporter NhaC [Bacillaceae]|uniref:Na+/H+ antiporter NhaC n=1 Tax=Bacillaceae TaxID=186817 RepID=UPI0005970935|nr:MULTISPECIES: Na+/H+ antiporter NhaC [Bacillus]KIL74011.1 Na+/H+ antiporter NhaC [Bacillus badius]RJS61845.1 Na+/H+ antiporter NhaC [Bacillus sp. PK3_68]UAT32833.1 Na+/H+ antiporter NhaC [Bacillus badius]GLY11872.1 Na+/H+ antiporter NhaC [Bacillus badius]
MNQESNKNTTKDPSVWIALVPIIFMACALAIGIGVFGTDPHVPLLLSTVVAVIVALRLGHKWNSIEEHLTKTISVSIKALLILVIIGAFIGSWVASGIVPSMVYYGLGILSPTYFLVTACLISVLVSIAGNAWFAAGTIGVALMGIGHGLGIPLPMVAGAVVSGVYFGDKMSPLSDVTNFTSAVVNVDLFEHIRNLMNTTVPTLIISLLIYTFLGFRFRGESTDLTQVVKIREILSDQFVISPFLLLPLLVIVLIFVLKIPAIPGLTVGVLVGTFCALFVQHISLGDIITVMNSGYTADTGYDITDELLNQGGIQAMMYTVSLILIALSFGGVLEKAKILEAILGPLLSKVKRTGSLIAATAGTCITSNIVGCDQFMSVIIPGRMYLNEYKQRGLHPKLLGRTLEDCGTVTACLMPWTTCGIFMFSVLGVSAVEYAPYAFFCYISTFVAIIFGYFNIKINRLPLEEQTKEIDVNVKKAIDI